MRHSQEGRQEPGPHSRAWSLQDLDHWLFGRPLSGSLSTAPQGVRNGGSGTTRPHTLLSFEGASPLGAASTSPRGSAPIPNRPARPARRVTGPRAGNLENYIASASIFRSCQVTKGTWWMPRRQKPMKDVGGCDKPRGAANQALIRGCPNGETRHGSCRVTPV